MVQLRSWTLSPEKYPDKMGKDVDGTNHAKSTCKQEDNRSDSKTEEKETDQMGAHPHRTSQGVCWMILSANAGHC